MYSSSPPMPVACRLHGICVDIASLSALLCRRFSAGASSPTTNHKGRVLTMRSTHPPSLSGSCPSFCESPPLPARRETPGRGCLFGTRPLASSIAATPGDLSTTRCSRRRHHNDGPRICALRLASRRRRLSDASTTLPREIGPGSPPSTHLPLSDTPAYAYGPVGRASAHAGYAPPPFSFSMNARAGLGRTGPLEQRAPAKP